LEFKEIVREVKDAINIVDLISSYHIQVQQSGKYYKALCPFHGEKTPSFYIYPEKKHYHCFGCGATGDAIKFVQEYEKITFIEALKELAGRYSVVIPSLSDRTNPLKQIYTETFEAVAKHYHRALLDHPTAMKYLEERGYGIAEAQQFQIGYCDLRFPIKTFHLWTKGIGGETENEQHWKEWGLLNQDGSSRFYRRIMFPIRDRYGACIGFSGRLLELVENTSAAADKKESSFEAPKYINSPQTPFFNKSRILYLEHLARKPIQDFGFAIVVEGFFDAIRLHASGISNTVAAMGTAFSSEHFRALEKLTKQFLFIFDNDEAGKKAAERAFFSLPAEIRAMGCFLSGAKDPDEYLLRIGKDHFIREMASAKPLEEYLIDLLKNRYEITRVAGQDEYLRASLPILGKVKEIGNLPSYEKIVGLVAGTLGIERQKVASWYEQHLAKKTAVNVETRGLDLPKTVKEVGEGRDSSSVNVKPKQTREENPAEEQILAIYLERSSFRKEIEAFVLEHTAYLDENFRSFFDKTRKEFEPDDATNHLNEFFSKEFLHRVFRFMNRPFFIKDEPERISKALGDCFGIIQSRQKVSQMKTLERRIQDTTDPEEKNRLMKQSVELIGASKKKKGTDLKGGFSDGGRNRGR